MDTLLAAPRGLYGLRDKAIIQLLYSGLKRAEISAASIHDFDPERRRLKVADRVVPLKRDAADAISAYLLVRPKVKNSALLLSNRKEALGLRQVWQNAKKYVLKCGLNDKTSLETIRDTFVVHALDDGIDINPDSPIEFCTWTQTLARMRGPTRTERFARLARVPEAAVMVAVDIRARGETRAVRADPFDDRVCSAERRPR